MTDIDELLTPGPPPDDSPGRRDALWQRMAGVQRRRRWLGRARRAALVAACYAAGAGSVWWWQRSPRPEEAKVVAVQPEQPDPPPVAPAPPSPPGVDLLASAPPRNLERLAAAASGRERVDLYRRAGDRYLDYYGDHAAAIRCYRRALDSGSEADLAVQADKDNWLLMSLKLARLKERHDAND